MTRERVIVDAYGPDDEALQVAMRWLVEAAGGSGTDAAIVVPSVAQLDRIEGAVGGAAAARMKKDRQLAVEGVLTHGYTMKTLPMEFSGPLLALWLDDEQMPAVEDLRPAAICVVPWNNTTDLLRWTAKWAPRDLRTGVSDVDPPELDPLLEAALGSLTSRVNLGTGLSHSSDKSSAVSMFRILKKEGIRLDSVAIEAFAEDNGWRAEDAADLADVARRIAEGKAVRTDGRQMWADDILDQWRSESA